MSNDSQLSVSLCVCVCFSLHSWSTSSSVVLTRDNITLVYTKFPSNCCLLFTTRPTERCLLLFVVSCPVHGNTTTTPSRHRRWTWTFLSFRGFLLRTAAGIAGLLRFGGGGRFALGLLEACSAAGEHGLVRPPWPRGAMPPALLPPCAWRLRLLLLYYCSSTIINCTNYALSPSTLRVIRKLNPLFADDNGIIVGGLHVTE